MVCRVSGGASNSNIWPFTGATCGVWVSISGKSCLKSDPVQAPAEIINCLTGKEPLLVIRRVIWLLTKVRSVNSQCSCNVTPLLSKSWINDLTSLGLRAWAISGSQSGCSASVLRLLKKWAGAVSNFM